MHTEHDRYTAPSRDAPYTGSDTGPKGLRVYSAEPRTHPDKPYPRAGTGHFWLDVLTEWFTTMQLPIVSSQVVLGRDSGWLTMIELRKELLDDTPPKIRDQAWRHVLQQARAGGYGWHYFALGLGMPGLWNLALRLTPRKSKLPPPQIAKVHRTLATEFVLAIGNVDIDQPHILARMLDQASYAARGHPNRTQPQFTDVELDHIDEHALTEAANLGASKADRARFSVGEAYLALARLTGHTPGASADGHGRLSREDAQLIAYTYLEGHTLADVADRFGLSESGAQARREAIKKKITRLLGDDSPYAR